MRHPTVLFLVGLVIAIVSWVALASFTPGGAPADATWRGPSSLLAGPSAFHAMHMWGGGPYVLSASGGAPAMTDCSAP